MADFFDSSNWRLSDVVQGITDFATHPLTLGTAGAVAGAFRPIPTRFGMARAGLSGAVPGGLQGMQVGMEFRKAAEEKKRRQGLSEALQGMFEDEATKQPNRRSTSLSNAERAGLLPVPREKLLGEPTGEVEFDFTTPQSVFEELPDPAQYKGMTGTDTDTGRRYRSNGSAWEPIEETTLEQARAGEPARLGATMRGTRPREIPPTEQGIRLAPGIREYINTIAPYDPEGASAILGRALTQKPERPVSVSPRAGSFSALVDPATGKEIARFEGPQRPETGGPEVLQLERALQAMDERAVPADNPTRRRIEARLKKLTEQSPADKTMTEYRALRNQVIQRQLSGEMNPRQKEQDLIRLIRLADTLKDGAESLEEIDAYSADLKEYYSELRELRRGRSEQEPGAGKESAPTKKRSLEAIFGGG